MIVVRRFCLLLLLVVVGWVLPVSCAHQQRIKNETGPLAEALRFSEQDRHGVARSLGAEQDLPSSGVKVPAPGLVDIDSLIEVGIDKSKIVTGQPPRLDRAQAERMQTEHEHLKHIVVRFESLTVLQQRFVETYTELINARKAVGVAPGAVLAEVRRDTKSPLAKAYDKWVKAREEKEREEVKILDGLIDAYQVRDPEFLAKLDEQAGKGKGLEGLRELIEERLRDEFSTLNRDQERWIQPLDDVEPALELQLEAWLVSGTKRAQIHLPGYDRLDEGQVQRRHVSALDLSGEDRRELEAQWQSTVELSKTLERYRLGTGKLDDILENTKMILAPEVVTLIENAETLYEKWKDLDPKDFVDGTTEDLKLLTQRAEAAADTVAPKAIDKLKSLPERFESQLETARKIQEYMAKLAALRGTMREVTPEALPSFLFDTRALLTEGSKLLKSELPASLKKDTDLFVAVIDEELKDLYERANQIANATDKAKALQRLDAVKQLLSQPEVQRLEMRLVTVRDLYNDARSLVDDAKEIIPLLGIGKDLPRDLGTINSFRVPFEKIKDTSINLLKTPRRTGDHIEFRARLFSVGISSAGAMDPEPMDELEASFEVLEFGWHDRLSPSVVLVSPMELVALDEQFSFAPVLSWVHRYGVRPEQSGISASLQRFFDTSVGIHAIFVNFDPAKEVEVGLGATLSFWKERLQFGAGVNLMAPGKDDGQYYYFVGSDLISLLNTIGIGN
jgi:hypothetical protein